jgi:SAM-dependent methyltransferase
MGTERGVSVDAVDRTAAAGAGDAQTPSVPPCALCGQRAVEPFLHVEDVPLHVGVLWSNRADARSCAKGDLRLAVCGACGFVSNLAFEPERIDYGQKYDNALHASPFFQKFEQDLARHLIERYALRGKLVSEIGCGDGHFLGLLCELGDNRGVGYDPSHDPAHVDPLAAGRVEFVREHYSEAHASQVTDLLCCRQTLEHIASPLPFLAAIRRALDGRDTVVYFEVPNSTMPFRDLSIWDLIYEHCIYFTAPSLRYIFEVAGFDVLSLRETYEGQFLSLEARVGSGRPAELPAPEELLPLLAHIRAFGARFAERQAAWRERLDAYARGGERVVVWGGGARAVSFFNMLGIDERIEYVVDINPRKQGTYLAGSGQQIVAPPVLRRYRPDVVVVLNPLYRDEIAADLAALDVRAELVPA